MNTIFSSLLFPVAMWLAEMQVSYPFNDTAPEQQMDIITISVGKNAQEMICYAKLKCIFIPLHDMTLFLNFRYLGYVKNEIKWRQVWKSPKFITLLKWNKKYNLFWDYKKNLGHVMCVHECICVHLDIWISLLVMQGSFVDLRVQCLGHQCGSHMIQTKFLVHHMRPMFWSSISGPLGYFSLVYLVFYLVIIMKTSFSKPVDFTLWCSLQQSEHHLNNQTL